MITLDTLRNKADELNHAIGAPTLPCSLDGTRFKWNVGNYMIESANGGYALVQTVGENGATLPITRRFRSVEECYEVINGMIKGAHLAREARIDLSDINNEQWRVMERLVGLNRAIG